MEILFDIRQTPDLPQIGGALKMMIQASVVQIDGAHHSLFSVYGEDLGMDKSRGVFVDLNAGAE